MLTCLAIIFTFTTATAWCRELANLETVRKQALKGARSIISDDVMQGYVDMKRRIEVTDEAGAPVMVIPFDEAVEFGGGGRSMQP